ncbi:hypothetical protein A2U01_0081799, partial [Trifolium medium]|nr:hypothetical protein [Trifolium medium]
MKASPLPKVSMDIKKDNSYGSCGKSLFAEVSSSNGTSQGIKGKEADVGETILSKSIQHDPATNAEIDKSQSEVESVAESLG